MPKQFLKKYTPLEIDEICRLQPLSETGNALKIILEKQNLIIGVLENITLLLSKESIKNKKNNKINNL